jgi:hypothetical protein
MPRMQQTTLRWRLKCTTALLGYSMATSVSKSDALSWSFCGILTLIRVHCKMKSCPVEVLVRIIFLYN